MSMTTRFTPLLILGVFFIISCRNKKISPTPVEQVQTEQLDTIHVVAGRLPEKKIYRGSNSLSNDLLHTKLEVNFDWKAARMNGRATLKVKPYFYPVERLSLNARGMEIRTVEVFEVAIAMEQKKEKGRQQQQQQEVLRRLEGASFKYIEDSLHISLGRRFTADEPYYVVIDYTAKPNELPANGGSAAITGDKGLYFINPTGDNPYKMPQIWTQGETQASSAWFPTIDSPNEKMTQEILISVDEKYTTLSNGVLVSSEKQAGGTRLDHWKQEQPHAPYLTMMAVGEFVKVVDEPWNGKEISYYVEKEYVPHAKAIFGETGAMIDFYSKALGVPYAWDKYAQVVARDYVSGAMENTSATLHGDFMVYQTTRETVDGNRGTAVIAHELFHQWFGDLVTCESWSNLPLNESFATYGEYLWEEHRHGRDAADEHLWQSRMGYIHSRQEADLIRFDYKDKEDMFDAISYNKGGQVLHMLRKAVGDEAFFASLKKYLTANMFRPVEVHHLRLAFEEVTGHDMNWFFNQWFLAKGRPSLKVQQRYDGNTHSVQLTVEQVQDLSQYPLYRLPLDVDLYFNGNVTRTRIVIDDIKDTFSLAAPERPLLVNFDAERQLLADISYDKTEAELMYQYRNAPRFMDRMEVLQRLEPRLQDSAVFYLFRSAAAGDRNAAIRQYAIGRLEKSSPTYSAQLKGVLTEIFLGDSSTLARAQALGVLNRRFLNDGEVINLTDQALKEQSYAICAEALSSMAKRDPSRALRAAKPFEDEKGKAIIFAIAALYSSHGSDPQLLFFRESVKYVNGFDMLIFCSAYSKMAQRCNIPANVVAAATDLEMLGKGAGKYTRFAVTKALKDILSGYEAKESSLRKKAENDRKDGKPVAETEKELRDISETRSALQSIYERAKNS